MVSDTLRQRNPHVDDEENEQDSIQLKPITKQLTNGVSKDEHFANSKTLEELKIEHQPKPATSLSTSYDFFLLYIYHPLRDKAVPHIKQQLREMSDNENGGSLSPVLELLGGAQLQAMLLVYIPTYFGHYLQTGNYSVDVFITSLVVALIVAGVKVFGYALQWLISEGKKEEHYEGITMRIEYYRVDKWGEPQVNLHHQSISWLISTRSKTQTKGDFRVVPYEPEYYNSNDDEFDGLIPEFNLLPRTDDELVIEHEGAQFSVYFQFAEEAKKNEQNNANNGGSGGRAEDMYGGSERGTPRAKPEPPIIIRRKDVDPNSSAQIDLEWMEKFLFNVSKVYVRLQKKNQTRARFEHNGYYWRRMQTLNSNRGIDSVALDSAQEELLHRDLEVFHQDKKFYERMGLPYRRGYLFSGKPGTGKTSLINAISFTYGRDIYSLNLKEISDDSSLQSAFASVPKNSIIVLEDVDAQSAVVHSRERRNDLRRQFQNARLAEFRAEQERKQKLKEKEKMKKLKKKQKEKEKKLEKLKKKKEKAEAKKKAKAEKKEKEKEKKKKKKELEKERERRKANGEEVQEEEEDEDTVEEEEEEEEEEVESEQEAEEEEEEEEAEEEVEEKRVKIMDDDIISLPDSGAMMGPSPFGFSKGGFGGFGGIGVGTGGGGLSGKDMSSVFGRITLSALLSCLDGHSLNEGVIIVLTSNHPEILDPALIRPGRIDLHLKLGYCTRYQLASMYRSVMDLKPSVTSEPEEELFTTLSAAEVEQKKLEIQRQKEEERAERMKREQQDGIEDLFVEVPERVIAPCDAMRIMVLHRSRVEVVPDKLVERANAILLGANGDAAM